MLDTQGQNAWPSYYCIVSTFIERRTITVNTKPLSAEGYEDEPGRKLSGRTTKYTRTKAVRNSATRRYTPSRDMALTIDVTSSQLVLVSVQMLSILMCDVVLKLR